MIVVDTSVWIGFFRGRDAALVAELRRLLDEDLVALAIPVRIELLSGIRAHEQARLARLLGALPTLRPEAASWELIEQWVGTATAAGVRFGLGDLLVGALAAERGAPVWSLDQDFDRMEDLGLLTCHRPAR